MKNYTLAVLAADKNNIEESFKKAIAFLEKDSKNALNAFYASDYKYVKKNNPDLFEKVKAFIEDERLQPLGAWWSNSSSAKISDENLARNVLFSQKFFKKNFGKIFRTGYGEKIGNPLASEILFRGRLNCYVESDSLTNAEIYWIDAKNTQRIMGANANMLGVKSIDEVTADEETVTFDKYFYEVYNTLEDIDVIAEIDMSLSEKETEAEKHLLALEKKDVVNVIKNGAESQIKAINCAWKKLISGDETAECNCHEIENIAIDENEIFVTSSNTVELVAFKKCCRKNDDIIIRIRQTQNVSEKIFVKSKLLDTCFWVDIEPYEIRSFIINSEGTPQESNLIENINL